MQYKRMKIGNNYFYSKTEILILERIGKFYRYDHSDYKSIKMIM